MPDLDAFERGEVELERFDHRRHVELAWLMLRAHGLEASVARYGAALRRCLERAGRPEAFHATVTLAFLSLIAERMARAPAGEAFGPFIAREADLLERGLLTRRYTAERLADPLARRQFLLPA